MVECPGCDTKNEMFLAVHDVINFRSERIDIYSGYCIKCEKRYFLNVESRRI